MNNLAGFKFTQFFEVQMLGCAFTRFSVSPVSTVQLIDGFYGNKNIQFTASSSQTECPILSHQISIYEDSENITESFTDKFNLTEVSQNQFIIDIIDLS